MKSSDAGVYEVRINSTDAGQFMNLINSPECDSVILPYTGISFFPCPSHILFQLLHTYYLKKGQHTLTLRSKMTRAPWDMSGSWYKNAQWLNNGGMYNISIINNEVLSLQMKYKNARDVVGDYLGIFYTYTYKLSKDGWFEHCPGYQWHINHVIYLYRLIEVTHWRILTVGKCLNNIKDLYSETS